MKSAIVAALALALFGLSGGLVGCERKGAAAEGSAPKFSSSAEDAGRERASAVITGLRAKLIDQETVLAPGRISWWTHWRVCWTPVPGAISYYVTAASAEGAGPPVENPGPCYSMSVANGIATRVGERVGRSHQLSLMAVSLSVTVAARMRDGRVGPISPVLPAGREFP